MTRNKKNVTVTLDPEVARWARVEAASRGTSVSRMLGEMLEAEMKGQEAYERAKERFFAQAPGVHRADGRPLPTREELHDRAGLR
ncbi:MAG: CopG family transcriptional regulator [Gemmatimonadota bacterium]|nr:CopG family transcriptional regulator [Gemmatimonadota bacterium]